LSQLAPRVVPTPSAASIASIPGAYATAPAAAASGSSCFGVASAAAALSVIALAASAGSSSGKRSKAASVIACQATPKQIPVVDLEGTQIGEETLDWYTLGKETANYVVHQNIVNFLYMRDYWPATVPRRGDLKKGKKPRKQKGSGRSRQGSKASPLFGKAITNKGPYGLDSKRNKKNDRKTNYRCISTVLMSKWKHITLVDGLEDFKEPSQKKLMDIVEKCTGTKINTKYMMLVTRHGYGEENVHFPDRRIVMSPIYLAGRLIPRFSMRRPRDLDPESDGLFQCLKARRILMSREAFFDLCAKYDKTAGWALKTRKEIELEQLAKLAEEYPRADRKAEIAAVQQLPTTMEGREFWAKEMRLKEAAQAAE